MKRLSSLIFILVIGVTSLSWGSIGERPLSGGCRFGFGLPKVPYRYRLPISITGGLLANYQISDKFMIQGDANGLTTFNLGTVDGKDDKLKLDLAWAGLSGMYKIRGKFSMGAYLSVGAGYYRLNQTFNEDHEDLYTYGLNLGISNGNYMRRLKMIYDLRWHLLFDPSPNPQVLTFTLGFLL